MTRSDNLPPLMNTYRWVVPVECPSLGEGLLFAVPPFGCPDDAQVMFTDPAHLLTIWSSAAEHNAPQLAGSVTGLAAQRAMRALLFSPEAPASMPVVKVSTSGLHSSIWIAPCDAALISVAAERGCTRLPIVVTSGRPLKPEVQQWLAPSPAESSRWQPVYRSWFEQLPIGTPPAEDQNLTQKVLVADLATHVDRMAGHPAALSMVERQDIGWADKSRTAIDRLVCTGAHAVTLPCLDNHARMYFALPRFATEQQPPCPGTDTTAMELLDRFDAGHRRWVVRHKELRRALMTPDEFKRSVRPLNQMVTRLGRTILANPQALEWSADLLGIKAQQALERLALNSPDAGMARSQGHWAGRPQSRPQGKPDIQG